MRNGVLGPAMYCTKGDASGKVLSTLAADQNSTDQNQIKVRDSRQIDIKHVEPLLYASMHSIKISTVV